MLSHLKIQDEILRADGISNTSNVNDIHPALRPNPPALAYLMTYKWTELAAGANFKTEIVLVCSAILASHALASIQ